MMKSSTIRRSALSRETMNVIENLVEDNQIYDNYTEDDNTPGEYVRQDSLSSESNNKSKEIDLLWQSFMPSRFNTNSPMMCAIGGFLVGIILTLGVLFLLGTFSNNTNHFAITKPQTDLTSVEATVASTDESIAEENSEQQVDENSIQQAEDISQSQENNTMVSANMKRYVIKEGDTVEGIIKHFYGTYSPEKAKAIMEANNLKNLDRISIDQVLLIPVQE